MSRLCAIGFAASLLATSAAFAAGPMDVELEVGAWRNTISGDVRDRGGDIDVESELGLDDATKAFMRARLHVMALGNFYAAYAPLDFSATSTLISPVTFGNFTFAPGPLQSQVDLKMYDVGWTFTPLDVAVAALELGVNAKLVDGSITLSSAAHSEKADVSVPLPMVKAVVRIKGPFISAVVDGSAISYDGNHLIDLGAQLKLSPAPLFYITGGYRYLDLELEDGDTHAAVKNQGPFVGVGLEL